MVARVEIHSGWHDIAPGLEPLPRISPAPVVESIAARLQARVRYAANTIVLLRWGLIALVAGPVLAGLFGFLCLCSAGQAGAIPAEVQAGPVVGGTLFLILSGTAAALALALPSAAGFRVLMRARLRRQLRTLPQAHLRQALEPLRRDPSPDARKIADALLRDLRPHGPGEVAPAILPEARGTEPSPG